MKRVNRNIVIGLIVTIVLLFLYKSTKTPDSPVKTEPAKTEPIEGTDLKRVILTDMAAQRLGIETVPVRWSKFARGRTPQLVVPYASVIYDLNGETWVYTNPEPLIFVRHSITVDYIEGDLVYLTDGPPPETLVVTIGVAELYGTETGVGK